MCSSWWGRRAGTCAGRRGLVTWFSFVLTAVVARPYVSCICELACSCARCPCPTWTQAEACVPRPPLHANAVFWERVVPRSGACACTRARASCRGDPRPGAITCLDGHFPASSSGRTRTCARLLNCRRAAKHPLNLVLPRLSEARTSVCTGGVGPSLELGAVSRLSCKSQAGCRPMRVAFEPLRHASVGKLRSFVTHPKAGHQAGSSPPETSKDVFGFSKQCLEAK